MQHHDRCDVPDDPDPPGDDRAGGSDVGGAARGALPPRRGNGEALNEHIFGDRWPEADERLEMLEEAVGGDQHALAGRRPDHRGPHYRVEHARIYDLPDAPPQIIVSGFGPKAVELAARIGDGYCTVGPDADSVQDVPLRGAANGAVVQGGLKVCWGEDEAQALADRASPVAERGPSRRAGADPADAGAFRAGRRAGHRGDGGREPAVRTRRRRTRRGDRGLRARPGSTSCTSIRSDRPGRVLRRPIGNTCCRACSDEQDDHRAGRRRSRAAASTCC